MDIGNYQGEHGSVFWNAFIFRKIKQNSLKVSLSERFIKVQKRH